jgi:hypothetical protein
MFDMEVIVRRQNQEHCASITCMIRHYVARRAQVAIQLESRWAAGSSGVIFLEPASVPA